jgi:hypothetical protein
MKKTSYVLILIVSFLAAGLGSIAIVMNDGGYFSWLPLIVWFIWAQIFVVPKILKK